MTHTKIKVFLVLGTRPDAIKMIPILKKLKINNKIDVKLISTGQHQELLEQVFETFGVQPDIDLKLMRHSQTLSQLTTNILLHLENLFSIDRPNLVLAHGDTTTCYATALSCFYHRIPIYHIEAGLRSHHLYSPYPEEFYRKTIALIATHHFSPTPKEKNNLMMEGILDQNITVIGHTIYEALEEIELEQHASSSFMNLLEAKPYKKIITVTLHRRENITLLRDIMEAIHAIALQKQDCLFVYPVHPNPIFEKICNETFHSVENIFLVKPLNYYDFIHLLKKSILILTDSGSIQEEAAYLDKPIFILRECSERSDGVFQGSCKIIGVRPSMIKSEVLNYLEKYRSKTNSSLPTKSHNASNIIANYIEQGWQL